MPDFPAPAEVKAAACRAIEADINQYAITWGADEPPPGDRRACRLVPGLDGGPRDRDHRHLRQHRGDARRPAVADQPGRRGDPVAAVLRELLARLRPGRRRRRGSSRSGPPHWTVRPRRAGRRVQRPDQGDHPLQPEQPDRHGLLPRRPRGDRRALPQVGRDRDHRRDLRAHHLRRPAARRAGRPGGDAGALGDDQRDVEDLRRDRLAGRHDDRPAAADARVPPGPRLRLDRRRRPAAGGRRRGLPAAPRLLRPARRRLPGPPRPVLRGA